MNLIFLILNMVIMDIDMVNIFEVFGICGVGVKII